MMNTFLDGTATMDEISDDEVFEDDLNEQVIIKTRNCLYLKNIQFRTIFLNFVNFLGKFESMEASDTTAGFFIDQ